MQEYLTVKEISKICECSIQLVNNLLCRSEFAPHRFGSYPLKIHWIPSVEIMIKNLVNERFKHAKNNKKRARSVGAVLLQE